MEKKIQGIWLIISLLFKSKCVTTDCVCCVLSPFSHVWLFAMLWTVAWQAPLSMGFSRQEHWSGLPYPPPGDLPNSGIDLGSPALQVDSLPAELPGRPRDLQGWPITNQFCLYTCVQATPLTPEQSCCRSQLTPAPFCLAQSRHVFIDSADGPHRGSPLLGSSDTLCLLCGPWSWDSLFPEMPSH